MSEKRNRPPVDARPRPTGEAERRANNAIRDSDDRIAAAKRRTAEIDRLGDQIAVLAAQINAAVYELLVKIGEFDRREGWVQHGARSCAHWLAWRTSLDLGAARERVRVARALEHLPVLAEAMRKGQVSYSKARALTRIATPATDRQLVDLARSGTTAHLETIVRACRRYGPKEELDRERRAHACRYLQFSHDDDGMVILRARLDPIAGAAVLRALDAAGEALYQRAELPKGDSDQRPSSADAHSPSGCRDTAGNELLPSQRRADALVLLAESALASGLDPGTRGDRYQVTLHVDAPVLADPAEPGVSALADGRHVSAESCRRVACDAAVVAMTHAPDGSVLDVGRKTRTISPALRRALTQRDRGCRFPGCGLALCDAHHIRHWGEGGDTSLDNTMLLCSLCRTRHKEHYADHRIMPRGTSWSWCSAATACGWSA